MLRWPLFAKVAKTLMPSLALLGAVCIEGPSAEAAEVTALVPAYFYPTRAGSPWNTLNAAAARISVEAIMNPASGPGPGPNSDYQYAVGRLQASGGKVIGYVATGYGTRAAGDILTDVQSYIDWYGVDGIFLDEMGNQYGDLDYVALYTAIKHLAVVEGIELHVVANAGTPFAEVEPYLSAADTLVIFEGPFANANPTGASFSNYPNKGAYAKLRPWYARYDSSRFANLVFDASTAAKMQQAVLKAAAYNVAYIFVTNDTLTNPWDTLPPYWSQEISTIEMVNIMLGY